MMLGKSSGTNTYRLHVLAATRLIIPFALAPRTPASLRESQLALAVIAVTRGSAGGVAGVTAAVVAVLLLFLWRERKLVFLV